MHTLLLLDIDQAVLAELLAALSIRGEVLAIRAGQEAFTLARASGVLDLAAIRTLLTVRGLTPRQCDLVLLDVQGRSRADIAQHCGVSPATVKKYWARIYAKLGIRGRQALRQYLLTHAGLAPAPVLEPHAVGRPDCHPNCPPQEDYPAPRPAAILDRTATR